MDTFVPASFCPRAILNRMPRTPSTASFYRQGTKYATLQAFAQYVWQLAAGER